MASLVYGWILCVTVMRANRHDGKDLPALVEHLSLRGLAPAWWGGDHAYGTLANHAYFEDRNPAPTCEPVELVARMARPENGGRFTKDEFDVDLEAQTLTCPGGLRIPRTKWATRSGKRGWSFEFPVEVCSACPLRAQCVSPKAKDKGRRVFVIPEQERLIRHHLARRDEDDFRQRLRRRPRVERVIAGFAQCGGKQARRFGMASVGFDGRMSALAYNLRRLGSLVAQDEQLRARVARAALLLLFVFVASLAAKWYRGPLGRRPPW